MYCQQTTDGGNCMFLVDDVALEDPTKIVLVNAPTLVGRYRGLRSARAGAPARVLGRVGITSTSGVVGFLLLRRCA